ncbi:hypothetical protein [Streptomyces sp. NPDC089799]|uniref:hypothetical protein n=1 Tax=Streptomyces sp. NPDC089799 TaxID=3155066 RepID=UPI00342F4A09
MVISLSVVVLLLVLAWIFLRSGGLKFSHALVCVFLGFCLAGSGMAASLQSGLATAAGVVGSLRP